MTRVVCLCRLMIMKRVWTMSPYTFLSCHWSWATGNAACVEPSRPADGRYGETQIALINTTNSKWWNHHHFKHPRALILSHWKIRSTLEHDIRFVEDNWKPNNWFSWSWLKFIDGMEITQFTYFQQVGGLATGPWRLLTINVWLLHPRSRLAYDIEWLQALNTEKSSFNQNTNTRNTALVSDQDMLLKLRKIWKSS